VRDGLRLEREAHARTRQQFEEFKRLVARPLGVDDIVRTNTDRLSPTVPSTGTVLVETTDTNTPEQSVAREGDATVGDEPIVVESASPIARGVRNDPRTDQPSILQTFPYVSPVTKVYRRRSCHHRRWKRNNKELCASQVENTSLGDISVAAVEEGVHAMHSEVRYKCEVGIGLIFIALLLEHVA